MEYDFENAPDRSHTDLVKWDVKTRGITNVDCRYGF